MAYKPYYYEFNEAAFKAALQPYLVEAMENATDELLKIMKINVHKTVHGDGPGKPDWRKELDSDLRRLYINVADYYVEGAVGTDYEVKSAEAYRAMVINYGSGSAIGDAPIHAGPEGRMVWDEDMTGKHPSTAKTEYDLPDEFNQVGNHFIEQSYKEARAK